ncbi:hypothetical protein GWI33_013979 [Rhynchophorus ferrugineus]|uniref:Uncharacterized protein n=1 Tax=Rhynchophorus ferrugineus TaxID=354439 RepID=A0A834I2N3_RHYFE|nr:hypothetical protein GWI33_013979 [Rhynchophorus ferrugineus]
MKVYLFEKFSHTIRAAGNRWDFEKNILHRHQDGGLLRDVTREPSPPYLPRSAPNRVRSTLVLFVNSFDALPNGLPLTAAEFGSSRG